MAPGFVHSAKLYLRGFYMMPSDDVGTLRRDAAATRKAPTTPKLDRQKANNTKSEIFFPTRFNKRLQKSIVNILVAPKRLAIHHFNNMRDKIRRALSIWNHSKISAAGKTILINWSILSTPLYYLSVYPVPDSILDDISKFARFFFWSKGGNRKGMNSVSWMDATLDKSEGGLSIRNLHRSKISLMAKNVFKYLNKQNAIWVDILLLKYGDFNPWTDSIISNCSCFYRGLCRTARIIKPHCRILSVNPLKTTFMFDPWYFETPLVYKPTYLSMEENFETLNLTDFLVDSHWNLHSLNLMFGSHLNLETINHAHQDHWDGWGQIWRLKIAPRAKHFLWLLFHNGIKTYDFLYRLRLGPQTNCVLCSLVCEDAEHLLNLCPKSQLIWDYVKNMIGKTFNFRNGFSSRSWLSPSESGLDLYTHSVIAVIARYIWKARCNKIFKNENLDCRSLASKAVAHTREYYYSSNSQQGRNLILHNFTALDSPFMVFSAFWNCSYRFSASSILDAEAEAMKNFLHYMIQNNLMARHLVCTNDEFVKSVNHGVQL
ncbi:uncharacterized protein LOC120257304 [Dioscorea cayenensis subsp. rotundata]|uniref:Uncharacterized protein LOC120257304 n=1 Tax=Dioscorea cayennensis subsp. rotundata TaxID=55577 RepID=A0AB40B0W8_DIOCR|nr:uncharacterized protein LOC120257304 [Dioscorea cayenensis subsp. rotundata]